MNIYDNLKENGLPAQCFSSEPPGQSISSSHTHDLGIHSAFMAHRNSSLLQAFESIAIRKLYVCIFLFYPFKTLLFR